MSQKKRPGFTLIEMVLVVLLVGILAAVALPNFIDFRTDARNGAAKGALGGLRSAIAIARAAIALRESTTAPIYPVVTEMWGNAYTLSHPVLDGTNIMDPASGIPQNPWSLTTLPTNLFNSILDCSTITKPAIMAAGINEHGWCYDGGASGATGDVWANSNENGAAAATENSY